MIAQSLLNCACINLCKKGDFMKTSSLMILLMVGSFVRASENEPQKEVTPSFPTVYPQGVTWTGRYGKRKSDQNKFYSVGVVRIAHVVVPSDSVAFERFLERNKDRKTK